MTRPSVTTGELENPQYGTGAALSAVTLRDHATAPLAASSALRMPVAPSA
jgi:hypothetical protein